MMMIPALSFRQGVTIQEGRHELEQTQVLQSSINTLVRPLDTTRHLSTNTARSSYKPMSTTRSYGSTIKVRAILPHTMRVDPGHECDLFIVKYDLLLFPHGSCFVVCYGTGDEIINERPRCSN